MTITVGQLIERTYNRGLAPAGVGRPAFDILASSINATDLTMTLSGLQGYLPQSIVEFDDSSMELALTKETESTTTVDINERGYLETTAAIHSSGIKVWIDPKFPKQDVFDELSAVIGQLYGHGIYRVAYDDTLTYSSVSPVALPALARDVLTIRTRTGALQWDPQPLRRGIDYDVIMETTPRSIQFYSGFAGTIGVTYKYDFTLPTALTDDLTTTCGVPESLAPYLWMPVAGNLLLGKETARVQIDEVRASLASEGIQVGAVSSVGQAYINAFELRHLPAERRKLEEQNPVRFEWAG